jgi:hypothetical protein
MTPRLCWAFANVGQRRDLLELLGSLGIAGHGERGASL